MRALFILFISAGVLVAQEAPTAPEKPQLKDGKLTDPIWSFTYEAPGLELGMPTGDSTVIFTGRAQGLQVEIRVHEGAKAASAAEWFKRVKEAWTKKKRKLENVTEGTEPRPWIIFTEEKLGLFNEHHGSAFYVRGQHCFEVHAYVGDKTETSGKAIEAALKGLELGEDNGIGLIVSRFASSSGKSPNDPLLLLGAGIEYISGRQLGIVNFGMAVKVLTRARSLMKEDTFNAVQLWALHENGGLARLSTKDPAFFEEAIEWHTKAVEAAKKLPADQGSMERQAGSNYNLACAYSLAGKVDEGFAALYASYADKKPVETDHLSGDTDLNNLKKDEERWTKFWKEKVAADG